MLLVGKKQASFEISKLTLKTVLATYLFRCSTKDPSNWEIKGVALAGYTVACLCKWAFSFVCDYILTRCRPGVQHQVRLLIPECDWCCQGSHPHIYHYYRIRCSRWAYRRQRP